MNREDWSEKNVAQKGFTLIELLVVIAILGILAVVGVLAFGGFTNDAEGRGEQDRAGPGQDGPGCVPGRQPDPGVPGGHRCARRRTSTARSSAPTT